MNQSEEWHYWFTVDFVLSYGSIVCYCNCNTFVPLYTVHTHTDLNQPVPYKCGAHSAAILDTDGNEQLTPVTHFCIRKIMPYKSQKYLNVLEKYLEIEVLWKCT